MRSSHYRRFFSLTNTPTKNAVTLNEAGFRWVYFTFIDMEKPQTNYVCGSVVNLTVVLLLLSYVVFILSYAKCFGFFVCLGVYMRFNRVRVYVLYAITGAFEPTIPIPNRIVSVY